MIRTFFLLSSSLLHMPHGCPLLSLFPVGGQLAFFLWSPSNFVFVLDQTQTRVTDSNFILFYFLVLSKDFKDNQGCKFFSTMTALDISTVPTCKQFVAVYMGAQEPDGNGIILLFCAYSCYLTSFLSGSDFLPNHLPVSL